MLLPALAVLSTCLSVSGSMSGLSLGIVNDEVTSFKDCLDSNYSAVTFDGKDCHLNKASCTFITNIDQSLVELVS